VIRSRTDDRLFMHPFAVQVEQGYHARRQALSAKP